jgi:hypothetical protein
VTKKSRSGILIVLTLVLVSSAAAFLIVDPPHRRSRAATKETPRVNAVTAGFVVSQTAPKISPPTVVCTPAPQFISQVDSGLGTQTARSQLTLHIEPLNAPCYFDISARATDNQGAQGNSPVNRYYVTQLPPLPGPTPPPKSDPTPCKPRWTRKCIQN